MQLAVTPIASRARMVTAHVVHETQVAALSKLSPILTSSICQHIVKLEVL